MEHCVFSFLVCCWYDISDAVVKLNWLNCFQSIRVLCFVLCIDIVHAIGCIRTSMKYTIFVDHWQSTDFLDSFSSWITNVMMKWGMRYSKVNTDIFVLDQVQRLHIWYRLFLPLESPQIYGYNFWWITVSLTMNSNNSLVSERFIFFLQARCYDWRLCLMLNVSGKWFGYAQNSFARKKK